MPYLTATEERKLVRRWQRIGCTKSRNRVIMNIYPLIYKMARRNPKLEGYVDDAVNSAVETLMRKFNQFNLDRGLRFATWANAWIRVSFQLWADNQGLIHIPQAMRYPGTTNLEAYEKYADFAWKADKVLTITPKPKDDGDNNSFVLVADALNSKEHQPGDAAIANENTRWVHSLLDRLEPREREVTLRRCQRESLRSISRDYGISKERIRQIETVAMEKLQRAAGVKS